MFRWPISFTPLSLGSRGTPRAAMLEITPRAAAFTLAALSHVGHAAHLALVDAYLKGQVRLSDTSDIGEASRTVAASLAAPLVAAAELGVERLTLADLILLPRDLKARADAERAASTQPTRSPDSARMLLRAGDTWHWVRAAERFALAGCLGTSRVGVGESWHDVIAELPNVARIEASANVGQWPAPIEAEVREPSLSVPAPGAALVSAWRELALRRFGRAPTLIGRAVDEPLAVVASLGSGLPLDTADVRAERAEAARQPTTLDPASDPAELASLLAAPIEHRQPAITSLAWHGAQIDVALSPDLDGYQTLCLLPPPADVDAATIVPLMLDATRAVIVGLIGRPLAEHRSDPIALTLRQDYDGLEHITTLAIGESMVIVRNQVVFTAWVGSDGRAMLKLFPPGGMR